MEELGMTAGEFAEAFKSPSAKNEKESREYVKSFYNESNSEETYVRYNEATLILRTFLSDDYGNKLKDIKCGVCLTQPKFNVDYTFNQPLDINEGYITEQAFYRMVENLHKELILKGLLKK